MLRKTLHLLKTNPNIIFFQVGYITITFFILLLLYQGRITSYINYLIIFSIQYLLGLLLGVVFISGFGNALSEALTTGKSRISDFLTCNRKYFIKSILSALILNIYFILFRLLYPVVSPIILDIFVLNGEVRKVCYSILNYILSIFIMPFTALFLPAIYIDHYDIVEGLITGIRLAVRNYWRLVWVFSAIYIPIIINIIFIKDTVLFVFTPLSAEYIRSPIDIISGNVFSVSVIMMYLLEGAIFLVSTPLFFVIYKESSSKRILYL